MLRQIVYSSRADAATSAADLPEILRCSRRNNPELGITGVLILSGGAEAITYTQVIEGEPYHLDLLIDTITDDPRHSDLRILLDHNVELRAFGDWSMADMIVPTSAGGTQAVEARVLDALRRFTGPTAQSLVAEIAPIAA